MTLRRDYISSWFRTEYTRVDYMRMITILVHYVHSQHELFAYTTAEQSLRVFRLHLHHVGVRILYSIRR